MGDVGSSPCWGGGVSLGLKCSDADHGQTGPLVGLGLFEGKMPLWNLDWT